MFMWHQNNPSPIKCTTNWAPRISEHKETTRQRYCELWELNHYPIGDSLIEVWWLRNKWPYIHGFVSKLSIPTYRLLHATRSFGYPLGQIRNPNIFFSFNFISERKFQNQGSRNLSFNTWQKSRHIILFGVTYFTLSLNKIFLEEGTNFP